MRRTYMCFFPFLTCKKYFLYTSFSISNITSMISFSKITITSLSMSAVRNAPGTSITVTSWTSIALIYAVMRTDSVAAVGEVTSKFLSFSLLSSICVGAAFYFLHRFCFKNISTHSGPFFCFFVSCSPLIGWNITLSCICCIYDLLSFIPAFTNLSSPCFRFSCVKTRTMRFV